MLVLTRRAQEGIVIGIGTEEVMVRVLGLVDGNVRLGIDAPDAISVDREEVRAAKLRDGSRRDRRPVRALG